MIAYVAATHGINVAGAVAGSLLAIAALLALVWRAVVRPWLVAQLVDPVRETHKQVTVNGHSSDTPTILDLLADLRIGQQQIRADLADHIRTAHRRDRLDYLDDIERRRDINGGRPPTDPDRKD